MTTSSEIIATAPVRRRFAPTTETATAIVFFIALWLFWGVLFGDFLFAAQENSLFLFRTDFWIRWQEVPGGALFYGTAFFIQFFYYPLLGGLILAVWGAALQLATAKTMNLRGAAYSLSFLPTCFLTISTTWNGYDVYIPFNGAQLFAGFIGMTASLGVFAAFQKIALPRNRLIFAVVVSVCAYPSFGFWAPFAAAICGLQEATSSDESSRRDRWRRAAILLGTAILAPLLWFDVFFYSRTASVNIFLQGLLDDVRYDKNFPVSTFVYGFAILAPFFYALLFVAVKSADWARRKRAARQAIEKKKERKTPNFRVPSRNATVPSSTSDVEKKRRADEEAAFQENVEKVAAKRRVRLVWELAFVVWAASFAATYRAENFFNVLASNRALADGDWTRILELEARLSKPNEQNVALRNAALFNTGALAEKAFERPVAGASTARLSPRVRADASRGNMIARFRVWWEDRRLVAEKSAPRAMSETLFCYFGASNIAARIATDNFVASEGRAISFYRTLAFCAAINGEERLARRYLTELSQTLFYRNWANVRLAYLETPGFRDGVRDSLDDAEYAKELELREAARPRAASVEEAARRYGVDPDSVRAVAQKVEKARTFRPQIDRLTAIGYPNITLMFEVFRDDFDVAPRPVQEAILVGALFAKSADAFLENADKYLQKYPNETAPKAIDEGLATWRLARMKEDWNKIDYKFRPETEEMASQFFQFIYTLANPTGLDEQEAMREIGVGRYWGYASDDSIGK